MQRWVYGGRYATRSYPWPQCRYCGRAQNHDCKIATCDLCGSPQCFGNGSGDGTCNVCFYGYLPGWSGYSSRTCGYKGCNKHAIAKAPRVKDVCKDHAPRVKIRLSGRSVTLPEYVAEQIAHRDSGKGWQSWRLVD